MAAFFIALLIFSGGALAGGNPKYASIVMDADSGEILSQSNADKILHPASLTKAMTLLMVFEALEQGRIGLNDRVRMSSHAASMAPSKLGIAVGDTIRVKDAIAALVTKSANDVAAAMGEHLGGTESEFSRKMTRRAREIGMMRTVFVNASGLHDSRQVSTARDMAVMARFVIKNYPQYYRYFSMKNFTYQGRSYRNHNRLMETYAGMDGMKTGYVAASGFNLVASAVRNDRRLIGVVFGGRTTQSRNDHMAALLDRGFGTPAQKRGDILIADAGKLGTDSRQNVSVPLPERKPMIAGNSYAAASSGPGVLRPEDRGPVVAPQAYAMAVASPPGARAFVSAPNSQISKDSESVVGEGDAELGIPQRIESGLLAIATHTGNGTRPDYKFNSGLGRTDASYTPQSAAAQDAPWSVQVGAFSSRAATDQVLHDAMRRLPSSYVQVRPMIAPLKTAQGWLFRARLTGFSRSGALAACNYLPDCLPVAPQN
ncbi:MAG: D-alanyl-D-alanine carboxypeptidase [Alphaproteobacteria bacterium]|nr:D-alanyl-D-alanine carboxypeptidase [Alphaproteobacteria bacterium]